MPDEEKLTHEEELKWDRLMGNCTGRKSTETVWYLYQQLSRENQAVINSAINNELEDLDWGE